jgi:NADH:ubiquinone oxidoreductase subunit K
MISTGEVFALFILVIGALETAVSLSIVLGYYRLTNKNINNLTNSNVFFS